MSLAARPRISVIIPTLNESANLERCLLSLPASDLVEVIVADGGSHDDTVEMANKHGAIVLSSQRGRAVQMNAAADCAKGDILLFLHADTILPPNAYDSIASAIEDGYAMGCFERKFDSEHALLRVTSCWAGWRAKVFFLAYGDQAIFLRRDLFEKLNGYRPIRRFEDVDLSLRARAHGKWVVLPGPIVTSARRFARSPLRRVLKDACLTLAWLTGIIKE